MRTLITFILRLWIDPQVKELAWEGQVECVVDGARVHIRGLDDLARFVEAKATEGIPTIVERPLQSPGGKP